MITTVWILVDAGDELGQPKFYLSLLAAELAIKDCDMQGFWYPVSLTLGERREPN
jgi:hypothetical protein